MFSTPNSKKPHEVVFKLNSDDYDTAGIRQVSRELKNRGLSYKYYRTYSNVKLMSWGVFRVDMGRSVSFDENDQIVGEILTAAGLTL